MWSLWKRLQIASPDITQAVGMVVQRYVDDILVNKFSGCPIIDNMHTCYSSCCMLKLM